jgi:hypothetical protein
MTAHAELGASSSSRWMNCPGSVRLSRPCGGESATSSYAAEGTVAHAMAEAALAGTETPEAGEVVEIDGHKVIITAEMEDAVETYLGVVRPLRAQCDWHAFERRVVIRSAPPQAECFGVCDFAALVGRALHIVDFKFGKGIVIDPAQNSQELYYALGCYETFVEIAASIREICLVIVQPRIDGARVKEWTIDLLDLLIWRDSKLHPAIQRVIDGDETLNDGEWCRFCPALASCPLKHAVAQEAARAAFSDNSGDLTPQELSDRLRLAMRLQEWIASIQEEAIVQIRKGEDLPGWKLVEGRSKRAWAAEDEKVWQELVKRAEVDSFKAEEFFEPPTLKSPFQVEKTLKRWKRDPKPILDGLVYRPPGKSTLVEESDPRLAMKYLTAAEQFRNSPEEDAL